ncbi:ATPase inhibitor, mitochondrial-like [Oscarella lobularis]|uniref:ATPase inhibitor, mitochondrial-like n=1 Tax=Oscarella lobularis TaxID=121494 RepID=UPI003313ACBE
MQHCRRVLSSFPRFTSARLFGQFEGGDGSIRSAGGSFAKKEQAQEDQYFRRLTQDQLHHLKEEHEEEIEHHAQAIKQHEDAIRRHKEKIMKHEAASKKDD